MPNFLDLSCPVPTSMDVFVYAKYVNAEAILKYSKNGGGEITLGNIDSLSCVYFFTISGMINGDTIVFSTVSNYSIAGNNFSVTQSPAACPGNTSAGGCNYNYNFDGTNVYIYITVDGSAAC